MITEMHYPYHGNVYRKEEAKLAILRDYYENDLSDDEVVLKYHISSKQLLFQWIGQYMGKSLSLSEPKETDLDMKKQKTNLDALSDQEKDLRIKSLEKALEMEKLRSRGFEVMIDVAEKQLNIPIRKKAGTKQ
jgi:transposase